MSEIEIITDGGRRRRWSASEKLRLDDEPLPVSVDQYPVARELDIRRDADRLAFLDAEKPGLASLP